MDLSKLSIDELRALVKDAGAEIEKRRKANKKKALEEIKKYAEEKGFSLNELLRAPRGSRGGAAAKKAVKYRHPEDAGKTWGGQGRQPNWVKEWLASGKSLDELR
jgi:DNA-binding protein H-NS